MVVDGAVVMVENIVRHMSHRNTERLFRANDNRDEEPPQAIREASHEVQRPVFYAIAIIITATCRSSRCNESRAGYSGHGVDRCFCLLGALTFLDFGRTGFGQHVVFAVELKNGKNPAWAYLTKQYRKRLRWCLGHRVLTVGLGLAALAVSLFLAFSGIIGSEFLPHLDEGAIWARGAMANSTSLTEGERFATQSRHIFASFPKLPRSSRKPERPTTEPTREDSAIPVFRGLEAQGTVAVCFP